MERQPHEEWILGVSESGRLYLIHSEAPRFICEIFLAGDDRGVLDSFSFGLADERSLANFVFIDEPPHSPELRKLLMEADRFLKRISASEQ